MPAKDGPRDLFDMLVAARDPETGEGFSRVQLCDQVATMILAGHETTALTLFWSLCLLAQSPLGRTGWRRRRRPTRSARRTRRTCWPRLPVTRAVVSEALRLYPPAFLITREALARDVAHRTLVPRGATVAISPWVLHRHSAAVAGPARLRPGALHARTRRRRRASPICPFGAGPRICVAAQFAMAEAVLVLAKLVGVLEVQSADARTVRPVGRVTTQPDRPCACDIPPPLAFR